VKYFEVDPEKPFTAGLQAWREGESAPPWRDHIGAVAPDWCNKHRICALAPHLSDSPYNHLMSPNAINLFF
jgi:hypothetical protein